MCLKYDYLITIPMNNQFNSEDVLVEVRDNIETLLIYSEVEEVDEYQDDECYCNLEDE